MWYLIISRPVAPRDEVVRHLTAHGAWQQRQHEAGIVLFSGPTRDRSAGIYVLRAQSLEHAQAIADSDPLHVEGVRRYELLEWEAHQVLGAGFNR